MIVRITGVAAMVSLIGAVIAFCGLPWIGFYISLAALGVWVFCFIALIYTQRRDVQNWNNK